MIKALNHPGDKSRPVLFHDGEGLALQITKGGAKSWLFRFQLAGKAREMGLGPVAVDAKETAAGGVTLAMARDRARAAKALLREGKDPIAVREEARAAATQQAAEASERTFKAAAERLIEAKKPGWRSGKHAAQWTATLAAYAYPQIGQKPVAAVTTEDVLAVLRPVWSRTPETGTRLRQRIEAVLDAAKVTGWRSGENPARWKGHLEHQLPKARKVRAVVHHPALAWQQMGQFMTALRGKEGVAAKALRFAILTAARSGEVRGALWREINLDEKVWSVPAPRMKGLRLHRVPLSDAALAVLAEVEDLRKGADSHVFPGARTGTALSDMSISMLVRGMCFDGLDEGEPPRWRDLEGRPIVPHGFRASFKGWSLAAGFPDPLSELAMAHSDKDKVRAAYAREDMLDQRRPMMNAWAEHCAKSAAAVASLAEARTRRKS
nr:site-specific integrase [Roseomonas rubea]